MLLLILGCSTEPESEPEPEPRPEDCAGVAGGNSYLDECGGCDANVNNDCIQDCADVWGGTAVEDDCGVCSGDNSSCLCDGLTEVELWGEWYDIESTTEIDLFYNQLTGSIPPEIGCLTNLTSLMLHGNQLTGEIPVEIGNLTNLTWLVLYDNQLTGDIPVEVCDLLESNNISMDYILGGNNLINTCE
jgi:Leucine-rich repeat (LRR) protein